MIVDFVTPAFRSGKYGIRWSEIASQIKSCKIDQAVLIDIPAEVKRGARASFIRSSLNRHLGNKEFGVRITGLKAYIFPRNEGGDQ